MNYKDEDRILEAELEKQRDKKRRQWEEYMYVR